MRTHHDACPQHDSGGTAPVVRWAMLAHLALALVGFGVSLYFDLFFGNLMTHALLLAGCLCVGAFAWLIRRDDLLSEDAKFVIFNSEDAHLEEDDRDSLWL